MVNNPEDFFEIVGEQLLDNVSNKKMNKLKSIWLWFYKSSANQEKISLTIKAGIPLLVLLGIGDTETLNHLFGVAGQILVAIGQAITGLLTAWGILRKFWFIYK